MLYLLQWTAIIGDTWQSQAEPMRGAEVKLHNGTQLKGDMWRNWDESWSLKQDGGEVVTFPDFETLVVRPGNSDASTWREWLPMAVLFFGWLGGVAMVLTAQRQHADE